jgi:hypothetical protein
MTITIEKSDEPLSSLATARTTRDVKATRSVSRRPTQLEDAGIDV